MLQRTENFQRKYKNYWKELDDNIIYYRHYTSNLIFRNIAEDKISFDIKAINIGVLDNQR